MICHQTKKYVIDSNGRRRLSRIGFLQGKLLYNINLFLYSHFHSYVFLKNNAINIVRSYASLREGPYYSETWNNRFGSNWIKIQKVLLAIKNDLDKRNIPFVIVIICSSFSLLSPPSPPHTRLPLLECNSSTLPFIP